MPWHLETAGGGSSALQTDEYGRPHEPKRVSGTMGRPVSLGKSEVQSLVALYPDLLVTVLGKSEGDSAVIVLHGLGFGLSRLINTDEPLVFFP